MTCLIQDLWKIIHNCYTCTSVYNRTVCTVAVVVHGKVRLLDSYDQ